MHPVLAEIFGPDLLIVLLIVAVVVFGGSQIPKLARSLGSAQSEFKKGLTEGSSGSESGDKPASPAGPASAADGGTAPAPGSGTSPAPGGPPSQ